MPKKITKISKAKKKKDFQITLDILGQKQTVECEDVLSGLERLITPKKLGGKGVLTTVYNGRSFSTYLFPARLKRFLVNKTFKEIMAKNITLCLK